jgi:hypothetical protein
LSLLQHPLAIVHTSSDYHLVLAISLERELMRLLEEEK